MKIENSKQRQANLLDTLEAIDRAGEDITKRYDVNEALHPVSSQDALDVLQNGIKMQHNLTKRQKTSDLTQEQGADPAAPKRRKRRARTATGPEESK